MNFNFDDEDYAFVYFYTSQFELAGSGGGSGSSTISYTSNFVLDKTNRKISFVYKNPSTSNYNVVLVIKVGDVEIARSGIVPPGGELKSLNVTDEAIDSIIENGYKVQLFIGYYDPETSEKAMVDTKANVTIVVKDDEPNQ